MQHVVDTQPLREVWARWQNVNPDDGRPGRHPWQWFVQPADVVVYGITHFMLGAWLGWTVDSRLFGPLTAREREALLQHGNRWPTIWRLLVQLLIILLLFNYARKALLLLRPRYGLLSYQHEPVPQMDSGFAMSLGFAWTQRNLVQRLGILLNI